ncbi:MAG TPA: hypothetical protein VFJ52_03795 [Terriglobia bacterium]|nr:hypothetical protein [Terriglobia bacterium]
MGTDLHLEKLALRLLCAGTSEGGAPNALIPLLRGYAWQSTLHQAIFRAIEAFPSQDPHVLRQLLPAKLTRMGFPDVEWDELFAPPEMSREDSLALVRQMVADA